MTACDLNFNYSARCKLIAVSIWNSESTTVRITEPFGSTVIQWPVKKHLMQMNIIMEVYLLYLH